MDFIKLLKKYDMNNIIICGPHGYGKTYILNTIKLNCNNSYCKYINCRSLIQIER